MYIKLIYINIHNFSEFDFNVTEMLQRLQNKFNTKFCKHETVSNLQINI